MNLLGGQRLAVDQLDVLLLGFGDLGIKNNLPCYRISPDMLFRAAPFPLATVNGIAVVLLDMVCFGVVPPSFSIVVVFIWASQREWKPRHSSADIVEVVPWLAKSRCCHLENGHPTIYNHHRSDAIYVACIRSPEWVYVTHTQSVVEDRPHLCPEDLLRL